MVASNKFLFPARKDLSRVKVDITEKKVKAQTSSE